MADTVEPTETVKPEALENKAEPTVTPVVEQKTEDSEVTRLRKEAEQAKMEANMLRNKLSAKEQAEADAEAQRLEKNQEYQTLYEQEKAKREEIERQQETAEQKAELTKTQTSMLSDYSDDVKALAEDTGLSLADVTDEAVADFKAKLDKIQTRVGATKVTPNNPGAPSGQQEYSGEELFLILNDPVKRDEYYRKKGGLTAAMMQPPQA